MIKNEIVFDKFPISEIIKDFPKSGQKQVLLVRHKTYGVVILKIVVSVQNPLKQI